jgi:hypothetical protein
MLIDACTSWSPWRINVGTVIAFNSSRNWPLVSSTPQFAAGNRQYALASISLPTKLEVFRRNLAKIGLFR